jgi:hypothetical protein
MTKKTLICLVGVVAAGLAAWFAFERAGTVQDGGDDPAVAASGDARASRGTSAAKSRSAKSQSAKTAAERRSEKASSARRAKKSADGAQKAKPREKPALSKSEEGDEETSRTPEERALDERIEKALEDESLPAASACVSEALKCSVAEIRQNMVDTLGWFGGKALPELTPFLADPDDDVRESALGEWTSALADIEDDGERIAAVESAMGVLNDDDMLEEISSEYIGVDEKLAVESLVRIIEGDGSKAGIEKAKETYEFVTGDEWTDAAGAAKWIAEEYEPPEAP